MSCDNLTALCIYIRNPSDMMRYLASHEIVKHFDNDCHFQRNVIWNAKNKAFGYFSVTIATEECKTISVIMFQSGKSTDIVCDL